MEAEAAHELCRAVPRQILCDSGQKAASANESFDPRSNAVTDLAKLLLRDVMAFCGTLQVMTIAWKRWKQPLS